MRFGFDHAFNKVNSAEGYFDLAKRGFTLESRVVEHPGSVNRFIMFSGNHALRPQYLEYSQVADKSLSPRLSLNTDSGLEELFKVKKRDFQGFEIEFIHRNYDWQTDQSRRSLGWNFLNFQKDIVPGVGVWITEYESVGGENKKKSVVHENTAFEIAGMIWSVSLDDVRYFELLTGKKATDKGIELDDGSIIWLDTTKSGKSHNFSAVVLRCRSLNDFIKHARPEKVVDLFDRKAAVIKQESNCWDIMAIE